MKPKALIALGIAAAVAVGAAFTVATMQQSPEPRAEIGNRLFPQLAARAEDIRMIQVQHKDGSFSIVRTDDRWTVPEQSNYPASIDEVRRVLVGLAELRALEPKTRSADLYPELQVEDVSAPNAKSVKLTLKDANGGDVLSVLVGKQRFGRGGTSAGDGVYIRRSDDAQAWLAQGRLTINREAVQWLDRKIVDVKRDRVRTVSLRTNEKTVTVSRAKPSESDFTLADVPDDHKVKSSWDVNAIGGAFESLELDAVKPAAEIKFPETPAAEAVTFDGLKLTAYLADQDGTWVRFVAAFEPPSQPAEQAEAEKAADKKDEAAASEAKDKADKNDAPKLKPADEVKKEVETINARVGSWAYKLPSYKIDTFRKKLDDLIEPKEKKAS
ncbi:MAG TPA: DUF4340 domain-containing protein [Alphaproteobacteria bacterium]